MPRYFSRPHHRGRGLYSTSSPFSPRLAHTLGLDGSSWWDDEGFGTGFKSRGLRRRRGETTTLALAQKVARSAFRSEGSSQKKEEEDSCCVQKARLSADFSPLHSEEGDEVVLATALAVVSTYTSRQCQITSVIGCSIPLRAEQTSTYWSLDSLFFA